MKVSQAETRLKTLLAKAGFEKRYPDPGLAWQVFKQFSREAADCADDGFLFQAGCYDFTGESLFYLDFVRQFTIEDETGEYDHMEQLHIEFVCPPDPVLEKMQTSLWAYDFDDLDAFFSAVESMQAFQLALMYAGWKCEIYQEEI